jgi:hypothetical protein
MSTPHPFRFGVTALGAASRQEWIERRVPDDRHSFRSRRSARGQSEGLWLREISHRK